PRRFGKSLLCSTLRAYFEGKKELFEGLKIMELETEWKQYPVFHFSISSLKDKPIDQMSNALGLELNRYEKLYGKNPEEITPGSRLKGLIQRAHEQTGMQAVVIIDEYDAPMLGHMHDEEHKAEVRQILQEFYQTLKDCDEDERFVFITGITKFSQMSIFSTINNISNITMSDRYSALCGITEAELHEYFDLDVEMLAEKYLTTKEGMYDMLKDLYDGYHFTENSDDIYNPFSLLLAFFNCRLDSYWFASGTPTFILEELKQNGADLLKYEGATVRSTEFDQPTENMSGPLPLLYQAGYLTIKKYELFSRSFTLGIPNAEVKAGLMENILPIVNGTKREDNMSYATYIIKQLYDGEYDKAMQTLQAFLSSIPYMQQGKDYLKDLATLEAFYQRDLYIFFSGMSANVQCEVVMAEGRTDMVMRIGDKVFVCEFKVSASAKSALDQIDRKRYYEPWRGANQRQIIKVGAYFDVAERTLKDWEVEEM
ncbi:MAG: AAA family ATPase, partial [Bacteroidales bacterium]|nr:AAA family ATPase [Bacteroidales bacterium]